MLSTMMQQKLIQEKLSPIEYTKRLATEKAYALDIKIYIFLAIVSIMIYTMSRKNNES